MLLLAVLLLLYTSSLLEKEMFQGEMFFLHYNIRQVCLRVGGSWHLSSNSSGLYIYIYRIVYKNTGTSSVGTSRQMLPW